MRLLLRVDRLTGPVVSRVLSTEKVVGFDTAPPVPVTRGELTELAPLAVFEDGEHGALDEGVVQALSGMTWMRRRNREGAVMITFVVIAGLLLHFCR
jgi:hypothetical protein